MVDPVCGDVAHPATAAARTETATAAGKGDRLIGAAVGAADALETVCWNAATEKCSKFPLHELWYSSVVRIEFGQEGLEISLNNLKKGVLFRLTSPIPRPRFLVVPNAVCGQSQTAAPTGAALFIVGARQEMLRGK